MMYSDSFKFIIKDFHENKGKSNVFYKREFDLPIDPKKITVLYGSRRCGKTFCLFNHINSLLKNGIKKTNILYINFEDDRLSGLQINDLNSLLEAYYELYPELIDKTVYFFFDEIQIIKEWESFVRRLYDSIDCRIFITGSSAKLLSREIATSLRGRCISYPLYPLNFREYLYFNKIELDKNLEFSKKRFKIKKLLGDYLENGSFPEVALSQNKDQNEKILKEYYDSLVYKDLADRFSLKNTVLLKDLLRYLFTNFTKEFSVNSYFKLLKNNMPISRETIIEYLNCIEETSYIYLIPVFSYSLKVQKANPKKVIALDNGIRNKICFRFSEDYGKLAENVVGLNLIKKYEDVFYYRGKSDVDYIVKDQKGDLHAVNVSYGDEISQKEYDSLNRFAKEYKNVKNLILISREKEGKEGKIKIIPLLKWLLTN